MMNNRIQIQPLFLPYKWSLKASQLDLSSKQMPPTKPLLSTWEAAAIVSTSKEVYLADSMWQWGHYTGPCIY